MPTGDNFVNLVLKRFLSQSRMNSMLLNYLQDMFYDGISRIFPAQGMFTYASPGAPYVFTNNADGTFTVGTDPLIGTDGEGHILQLTGSSRTDNIPFEDTAATNYWVGMHYIEVPNGLQTNPRTGQVEYDYITEEIGELGNPTSAADGGGGSKIKLVVDSILENGVDYSGREVRVWLTDPISSDATVAFETLTVSYSAGENSVTTVGLLGQSTLSTAAADYQVAALGVSVKKSATLPTSWSSGYCVIGYVTGDSAASNTDDAYDLSGGGGHTLQKAYDGFAGSGSGRNITVNDEAIALTQTNLTLFEHDNAHAALRLIKDGDRTAESDPPPFDVKDAEGGIDVLQRMLASYAYMCRINLIDHSGNDFLQGSEALQAGSGNSVWTTRVGVDLYFTGLNADIMVGHDLLEIVQSSNGNDGLYRIVLLPDSATFSLFNLDGSIASFTSESGTSMEGRVYRPLMRVNTFNDADNKYAGLQLLSADDFFGDFSTYLHIPLQIVIPAGAAASGEAIDVIDDSGSPLFQVENSGEIEARNTLNMNGNDIDTEGGDVRSGTGTIDSEGGVIQSGGGVIDSEGGIIRSGGANIDTEGGNLLTSDGDVNAGTGIIYTSGAGYVIAPQVSSYINVTADSNGDGSGDFTYGAAKQEWIDIPIADFRAGDQDGTNPNYNWSSNVWNHGATSLTLLIAPVVIPNAASFTGFRVKVNGNSVGSIDAYLSRNNSNWASPTTAPSGVNISGPLTNTGSGAWEVITDTSFIIAANNLLYSYMVFIECTEAADKFGGAQVRVSFDTISMF